MDYKVGKEAVTDGLLPLGHLDIFFFFFSAAHLQKYSRVTAIFLKKKENQRSVKLIKVFR